MLSFSRLQNANASAPHQREVVFLHGLFGRGANWETFARKLIAARPECSALLVDLRMHGDSQGFPPPHTLQAAAADVRALLARLGVAHCTLIGHSLGGKVTLQALADIAAGVHDALRPILREAWVLDASPSSRPMREPNDSTRRVMEALMAASSRFPTRAAFVAEIERGGVPATLGQWLSKNLVRELDGLRLALDLPAIQELLIDHDRADVWSAVESPRSNVTLRFVLGGRSTTVSPEDRDRLRDACGGHALELHVLKEAGHWLHVDDPDGLMRVMIERLGRLET